MTGIGWRIMTAGVIGAIPEPGQRSRTPSGP